MTKKVDKVNIVEKSLCKGSETNKKESIHKQNSKDKEKVLNVAKNILKDHKYAFEVLAE